MSKHTLSIRTTLLLTISALTLLIMLLAGRTMYMEWQQMRDVNLLKEATILNDKLFETAEKLLLERDIAFSLLHATDPDVIASLSLRLKDIRKEADQSYTEALLDLRSYDFQDLKGILRESEAKFRTLKQFRQQIDNALSQPHATQKQDISMRWLTQATGMVIHIQNLWMGFARHFSSIDPRVTLHMRLKHLMGIVMEYTGRQRALIGHLIVENTDPTSAEQEQLQQWQGAITLNWHIIDVLIQQGGLSSDVTALLKDAKSHYFNVYDMTHEIFYVPGAKHGHTYPITIEFWFELSNQTTDSLNILKNAALKETYHYVEQLERNARNAIITHLLFLCMALSLCAYSFRVILARVLNPIQAIVSALLAASEGKEASPLPAINARSDEIGKLSQVLHAFQLQSEEIKRASESLLRYTKDLERSNKELDDFAYIASHDLKEPLRGIHNHARFLLEDNADKLEQESVTRLGRLIYLSQRMERLVNDLLYFSRLGRQELAIQTTDVNDVIHDIESTLDQLLKECHVQISLPRPLPTIICDRIRVTELFRNLITNAIKYNDSQKKILEIGFLDSYPSPDGHKKRNVFYVKDNGRGIAPQFYNDIFRIFKRLQKAESGQEEGTGVGLTFVKKIIERHGGQIWLESEIDNGTVFYFTLEGEQHDKKNNA